MCIRDRSNMVETLEANGAHLIQLIEHLNGQKLTSIEGGGAAGGVAAGLKGLLDAQIDNGFDLLSKKTALEKALQKANIIFTGEGRFDGQTSSGKLPLKIAQWGDEQKKTTFIFAGSVDPLVERNKLPENIILINCKPEYQNIEEAMKLNMIVVITMWLPRFACRYPGITPQTAPNKAEPKIARRITSGTGITPPNERATRPIPSPPIAACPSPPILNSSA